MWLIAVYSKGSQDGLLAGEGALKKMYFSSHTTVSSYSKLTTYDIHTYI
jgi:hypothetical protein